MLKNVGAILPLRDDVDQRIINDFINTSGSIIDSPSDVGGYPQWTPVVFSPEQLDQYDSDKDGMPNDWELANNLNPNNADDRNEDPDNDGYTIWKNF